MAVIYWLGSEFYRKGVNMQNSDEKQVNSLARGVFENSPPDSSSNSETPPLNSDDCFGKPDKYDYSQVELPENYCYDDELLNEFNNLAAKYNLSQKSANELMSMAVKLTKKMQQGYADSIERQRQDKITGYKNDLRNDKDFSSLNRQNILGVANLAYNKFADDEVKNLLAETGLDCHPKFVKMFYSIGKLMKDDSVIPANFSPAPKLNREDILYPTML